MTKTIKIVNLKDAISKLKQLTENKMAKNENADEFVEIAEADGFKIYVAGGKTINYASDSFHSNARDVFMMLLEGEIEFTFENGEKVTVRAGECFVLPKHLKHKCNFKQMTVAVE